MNMRESVLATRGKTTRKLEESVFKRLEGIEVFEALEVIKREYVERQGWEKDMLDQFTFASHYFAMCSDDSIKSVLRAVDGRRTEGRLPICDHKLNVKMDFSNSVELSRFVGRNSSKEELVSLYLESLQYLFSSGYRCFAFIRHSLAMMIEKNLGLSLSVIGPQERFKGRIFTPIEFLP